MNKQQIGQRITSLRTSLKLTKEELGAAIGRSGVSVGYWEEGRHAPTGQNLVNLARRLGVTPEFLLNGDNRAQTKNAGYIAEPAAEYNKKIPVISWVAAGNWSEANEAEDHTITDWITPTQKIGRRAFALRVKGQSMFSPGAMLSIPDGAIVTVDPDAEPQSGNIVIAKLVESNEATMKRLIIDRPNAYLEPLNPKFDVIKIDKSCIIVGVVKKVEYTP